MTAALVALLAWPFAARADCIGPYGLSLVEAPVDSAAIDCALLPCEVEIGLSYDGEPEWLSFRMSKGEEESLYLEASQASSLPLLLPLLFIPACGEHCQSPSTPPPPDGRWVGSSDAPSPFDGAVLTIVDHRVEIEWPSSQGPVTVRYVLR